MNPSLAMVFYKRGHVNSFLGNYEKARADYERAGKLDATQINSRNFIAFTNLYQGQPSKAIQSLQNDARSTTNGKDKAKAATEKYDYLSSAAMIAAHIQDTKALQQIILQLQPASEAMAGQIGTDEAKRTYKAPVLMYESLLKALNKDFAGARKTAEEMKTMMAPVNNPRKDEDYHFTAGFISLQQKDFQNAVMHLEKLNKADVYNKYCLAKAYEGLGSKDNADAIYNRLVNNNFNSIGYALVRAELKKRLEMSKMH
jgi:tetratricopeptide (TPR) repeat protein